MSKIVSYEERPWGTFQVLSANRDTIAGKESDIVIKKITIRPQKRLSLQSHTLRTENWYFVSGNGEVIVDNKKISIKAEQSVSVPINTKHRISNTSTNENLVLIEISIGEFDESDIVRYEDDFGRAS